MIGEKIESRARTMGLPWTEAARGQFDAYHRMLAEANRTMNLTRVPDEGEESVDRHYIDSLSPLLLEGLFASGGRLIDVGSGAGFPGVPLSILCPQIRVVLLDSLNKRVRFLEDVIQALSLNAQAVHLRAEDAARLPEYRDQFDLATARAVAPLNVLVELTLPFVKVGGRMLALKGPSIEEELPEAREAIARLHGRVTEMRTVSIPGRDWDHRLLVIEKTAKTPNAFPRKAGEAGRQPIRNEKSAR